jgi:hypothetical protein
VFGTLVQHIHPHTGYSIVDTCDESAIWWILPVLMNLLIIVFSPVALVYKCPAVAPCVDHLQHLLKGTTQQEVPFICIVFVVEFELSHVRICRNGGHCISIGAMYLAHAIEREGVGVKHLVVPRGTSLEDAKHRVKVLGALMNR